jgi:hypothetical protein
VGQEQNSKLTVDFHESGFVSSASGENAQTLAKGFWFQLSDRDRGDVFGPDNPQSLSRYAYVLDNPLRYVDPTGHFRLTGTKAIKEFRTQLEALIKHLKNQRDGIGGAVEVGSWFTDVFGSAFASLVSHLSADQFNEIIDALSWVEAQIDTFLSHWKDGEEDDTAWIDFFLDVDRIDTSDHSPYHFCIVSYNSVTNGQNAEYGRPQVYGTGSLAWHGLFVGDYMNRRWDVLNAEGRPSRVE